MDKIWLKSCPEGVPKEIDATVCGSVTDLLSESFRINRDKRAFLCVGKSIMYGELDQMSARLAAWFQSRGMKPGARIAITMPKRVKP